MRALTHTTACTRLYERAEEAAAVDLPLEEALQSVRDGYSSIDFDRRNAAGEFE
jgi:hypothetical protein